MGYGRKSRCITGANDYEEKFYSIHETKFSRNICQVSIKKQLSHVFQTYFQPLK